MVQILPRMKEKMTINSLFACHKVCSANAVKKWIDLYVYSMLEHHLYQKHNAPRIQTLKQNAVWPVGSLHRWGLTADLPLSCCDRHIPGSGGVVIEEGFNLHLALLGRRRWYVGGWGSQPVCVRWGLGAGALGFRKKRVRCRCEPLIIEWHVSCHSLIVAGHVHIWALSHYSSSVCPTWPLSLPDTHTQTHKTAVYSQQTKPLCTSIFIHLSCSCVLNLEWEKLLYKILLMHYLPRLTLCCLAHHSVCGTTWTWAWRNPALCVLQGYRIGLILTIT